MQQFLPIALQTRAYAYRQVAIIGVGLVALVLFVPMWMVWLPLALLATLANGLYTIQEHQIQQLQAELQRHEAKETEYIVRTEQLRRALHDIRSPMSALGLQIHILKRNSDDDESQHLDEMKMSLQNAIDQVQMISDIQHGKVAPSETLQLKVKDIQSRAATPAE